MVEIILKTAVDRLPLKESRMNIEFLASIPFSV
jgi:hypothetical protein